MFVFLIQTAFCIPNENIDEKIINTRSIKLDNVEKIDNKNSIKFSDEDIVMQRITEAVDSVRTPKCFKDLNDTITAIFQLKPWAVASTYFILLFIYSFKLAIDVSDGWR